MKKLSLFLILNLPFFMGCSMNGEISSRKFEQLYQRKDQFGTVETIEFLGHDTKNAYIRKWTLIPMANKGKKPKFFSLHFLVFPQTDKLRFYLGKNITLNFNSP